MALSIAEVRGVALMILNGLISTSMVVSGKILKDLEMPYFRMMAIGSLLSTLAIAAGGLFNSTPLPSVHQVKWLLLFGCLRSLAFVCLIVAVRVGASPGDASALASINTVFAALLGRVFLGEQFQWKHGVAVSCSLVGAVLIAQPSFLFGGPSVDNMAWIGQLLGVVSGFSQACMFISARKCSSVKTSLWIVNLSPSLISTFIFALLSLSPLVDDFSLASVVASPWLASGFCVALFFGLLSGNATGTAASSWCPAAVSATVSVGTRMICGYVAQVALFDHQPETMTLCGAACMLVGVVVMAVGLPACQNLYEFPNARVQASDAEPASGDAVSADDTNESLASFIASEFGDHDSNSKSVRLRRGENHAAQVIGVVASVA